MKIMHSDKNSQRDNWKIEVSVIPRIPPNRHLVHVMFEKDENKSKSLLLTVEHAG